MAVFGKNKDLELIIQPYKDQIQSLKDEIIELKAERDKLLDSLLSIKTPEAYKEMRSDIKELRNHEELDPETLEKMQIQAETTKRWFEGLERPTFSSPDEMVGILDKWLAKDPVPLEPPPTIDSEQYKDS